MYAIKFTLFFLLVLAKKVYLFFRGLASASAARSRGFNLGEGAHIWQGKKGVVNIGKGVNIGRGTLIRLTPDGDYPSRISIGEGTSINEYNNIIATGGLVSIGKYCQIAQFCTIVANNHETETSDYMIRAPLSKNKRSIIIGDDVWIASNSVILAGVSIGNGSVVAAGSIVTRDVPPYTIVAGNPARVIRQRALHRR